MRKLLGDMAAAAAQSYDRDTGMGEGQLPIITDNQALPREARSVPNLVLS